LSQLSLPPRRALRTNEGVAQRTHNSTRLARCLRLLLVVAGGALLGNACLLDKMQTGPSPELGGERAEGGAVSNAGFSAENGQRGGLGGVNEAAGHAGANPSPAGGLGGVSGANGEAGKSQGGTTGPGGTAAGEAGLAGSGAGGGGSDDCLYTESSDLENDYAFDAPEETGLATSGPVRICGRTDIDHYEPGTQKIDVDSYYIDVPQAQEVMVTLVYQEFPEYLVELEIGEGAARHVLSVPSELGSFSLKLDAGRTRLALRAHSQNKPTQSLSYVLRVRPDDLEKRCPRATPQTALGVYSEANDGPNSIGNDYYRVTKATDEALSTATSSDKPEYDITNLHPGDIYLISGTAGDVSVRDDYADGDYYKLNTTDANQVTVRLDWDDSTTDLDLYYLGAFGTASAKTQKTSGPELLTFVAYYPNFVNLWVGGVATGSQYPRAYTLTVCAETFVP
jgi:hypothetical protein